MHKLSLIVDTNFFHECREIENVIVTSRVIAELDKQKNDSKPRIKRRALKVNTILASIIDANLEPYVIQETVPRVLLTVENIAPSRQYSHILDDRVTDDMIVATACALRDKYQDREFYLLSGDLGVAAKALDPDIQLAFKRIPDEWKRGLEEDEEQKEIRQLKEEIAKYKKQEPDIQVFVKNKNSQNEIDKIIISKNEYKAFGWVACICVFNQGNISANKIIIRLTARGNISIDCYDNEIDSHNANWFRDSSFKEGEFSYPFLQHHIGVQKIYIHIALDNDFVELNAAIQIEVFVEGMSNPIKKTIPIIL